PDAAARVAGGGAPLAGWLAGEAQALVRAQPWDGLFILDLGAMLALTTSAAPPAPPPLVVDPVQGDPVQGDDAGLPGELVAIDAELIVLQAEVHTAMRERGLAAL